MELGPGVHVLIACEESGIVTKEFRDIGINAYSCDILPTSGTLPDKHIQTDVVTLLGLNWDMIIAFPPCTHLSISGARWFPEKRKDGRQQQAINFFMQFVINRCPLIAIENPVGIMSTHYKKPDQYIQPYMFGHGETKKTGLWLKGLPLLKPTDPVEGREQKIWKLPPTKDRGQLRSKTYLGIAKAMASQWSTLLCN